jgi:hypothetical protein
MDHLDHLDQASNGAGFPGPPAAVPPGPPGPALLAEARVAGFTLRLTAGGGVKVGGSPPPELLARLRPHKLELAELLQGDRCRHCGEAVIWTEPNVLAFADRMSAHLDCYEQAETLRQTTFDPNNL